MTIEHLSLVRRALHYPSYLFWSMQEGEYTKSDFWVHYRRFEDATYGQGPLRLTA